MVLLRVGKDKEIKGSQSINRPREQTLSEISRTNRQKTYYAAVDIGTTTLSIEIYDQDGSYIGGSAEDNAQGTLGSDVMMRLMHVQEGRGEKLYHLIRDQIHRNIQQILSKSLTVTPISPSEINCHTEAREMAALRKITVVGNTVMCHLFLGKDTTGLRGAPFQAAYQGSYRLTGKELGWGDCPDVDITVLPGIAAHVGADAAAVLAVENIGSLDKVQLAIDLGTNAEIILNNHGKISVCSAAAGPAFEGRGISCGCRGGAGALGGVKMVRANGNLILDVVPEETTGKLIPRGLCGSGFIDAIAGLLENKLLESDGYLISGKEAKERGVCDAFVRRLEEDANGEHRFILFDPEADKIPEAGQRPPRKIFISQSDIRNFQLAKAAIQTGIALLCERAGLKVDEIGQCSVAGVFGAFLHPENAKSCGLLPNLPPEKIKFVGNAAGRGAAQALFEPGFVSALEKRVKDVQHVELAGQDDFQVQFMKHMKLCAWL
ncbi:MAG: ASKHA domain-containing protein [Eubacteriales bacterium]|nr:ASKHA domain-containing protein [Eubacteriales bacterium]